MLRRALFASLVVLVGLTVGYKISDYRAEQEQATALKRWQLHSSLNTAMLCGSELKYLQEPKESKASRYMQLTFARSVAEANKMLSEGVTPFIPGSYIGAIKRGQEAMTRLELPDTASSAEQLINKLEALQDKKK
jgi:hypothetical protein